VLATTLLIVTFVILSLAGLVIPLEMLWSAARDPQEAGRRLRRLGDTNRFRGGRVALRRTREALRNVIEKILFLMLTPILRIRNLLLNTLVGLIMMFLIAPLPIILIVSFSSSPFLVFPPPGFSFQWYAKFFSSETWRAAAIFSILLGVAASLVAVFVGTLASFLIVRGRFQWKRGLFFFLLSPLMVPHIILAIAFYGSFNDLGLLGTFQGLVIAHAVLATPYVVVVMSTALRGFDQNLEHAAATLGATPTRTLRKVTFPILRPALLTAGLLAFLVSFDDLLVTLFLLGRLPRTLPLQFWADITIMIDPVISAASSMIVTGVVALISLGQWMKYRQEKRVTLKSQEQILEPIVAGEHL
jgi:ABC-type spermidine/putrescine transport system permease subunit II